MANKIIKPAPVDATVLKSPEEPEYTVAEFAANAARLFGRKANADIVNAAFMVVGHSKATLAEARELVAGFMKQEVM